MSDTDPLLRAIAKGDPAAPDGRALAALGKLARDTAHPPRPIDLVDRVLNDIQTHDGTTAIDAWVEQGACDDAGLTRLLTMTRAAAALPHGVDLTGRVRLRMGAGRILTVFDDRTGIIRKRVRIIAAVIAGHLAAALVFALVRVNLDQDAGRGDGSSAIIVAEGTVDGGRKAPARSVAAPLLPPRLPVAWTAIRDVEADLFLMRRMPELRAEARLAAGLEGTAPLVAEGLNWLRSRQDATTGAIGRLVGDRDQDLATQSLAVLALLGDGPGDKERNAAARRTLVWIAAELDRGPAARPGHWPLSLAGLALVEGALLLGDQPFREAAARTLARIAADRVQPDNRGWSGFPLLAIETAQQGGLDVPGQLLQQERRNMMRGSDADAAPVTGHPGVSAFARYIFGQRSTTGTRALAAQVIAQPPKTTADGKVDLVGNLFGALTMREAGGDAWKAWGTALGDAIVPLFTGEPGRRHVPATKVDDDGLAGDGVVFATALAVLNLQTPYRYLPIE